VEAVIGMVSDISEKKRNLDLLVEAKHQAEEATRAKSEFLANMSHEIRTPMNAIMGLCHLALRTELNPKQQDYLARILASSRLLLRILNDILDISKIEAGRLEIEQTDFNLGHVLHHVQDLAGLRAEEKGLELRVEMPEDVPAHLQGDPLRLGQVLLNLVSNAVKFTERGTVSLRVAALSRDESSATFRFDVIDTGIGIPPDTLSRLFLPFSQADASTTRRFGGTGLGLAISKRLAEMMGGSLEAESVPGEGSTFRFTVALALQARALEPPAQPAAAPTALASAGARVLVVEDNATNRLITLGMLEVQGYSASVAIHGQEALDRVLTRREPFDLILMDVQMPVMDGLEAAARLRRAGIRIPILAMTAHAMESERQRCLEAGMNDHLIKPLELEALRAALGRWTNGADHAKVAFG
jgi:CheY-like chemotaxis protein/nitrogen-specific signal transduction histidine kinase